MLPVQVLLKKMERQKRYGNHPKKSGEAGRKGAGKIKGSGLNASFVPVKDSDSAHFYADLFAEFDRSLAGTFLKEPCKVSRIVEAKGIADF